GAGADAGRAPQNGITPLYVAAQNGHLEVLQALVDAGADTGRTALDVAKGAVATLLREAPAKRAAADKAAARLLYEDSIKEEKRLMEERAARQ
ncbi:hypothetical protein T484DRAFT_1853552, partial [Baffinella frigidus]